ncbi:hypothetical protein [Kitasatospora sp. NPDC093102]|uniref:hypothetical protein n=1 Tax=Kitasatospora sp. NPDC093102 TaxID=3155069 RepID=UPI00343B86C7
MQGSNTAASPVELQAYEVAVIREKLTEIRRFITGVVARHTVLQPKGRWIRHLNTQLSSVESALDVIADYIHARPNPGPAAGGGRALRLTVSKPQGELMTRRRCYPSDSFDDEWALIELDVGEVDGLDSVLVDEREASVTLRFSAFAVPAGAAELWRERGHNAVEFVLVYTGVTDFAVDAWSGRPTTRATLTGRRVVLSGRGKHVSFAAAEIRAEPPVGQLRSRSE